MVSSIIFVNVWVFTPAKWIQFSKSRVFWSDCALVFSRIARIMYFVKIVLL